MGHLAYKAIDVDNHYYETLDAFTRHLDKKFRRRGVQMFSDGRHTQAIIGDRVNRFVPNPTFDPNPLASLACATFETVDKKPFQIAVKPVWDKYGPRFADTIKRIQAVE